MLNDQQGDGHDHKLVLPMVFKQTNPSDVKVWNKSKMAAMGNVCIIKYRQFIFIIRKIVTLGASDWCVLCSSDIVDRALGAPFKTVWII